MKSRAKTISVAAILALLLAAGLWLLNRPRPAIPKAPPTQSAKAAVPGPAVAEPAPTIAAAPTSAAAPAAIAQAPTQVAPSVQPVSTFQPSTQAIAPTPAPQPRTPDPRPRPQTEIAATARMYAAHAPLRTPEVADPDSKTNKQILSTMVAKALAQPATPPPFAP